MDWKFDQAPNVACVASKSVMNGSAVLVATHYDDDRSWAFTDGEPFDPASAMVVAMGEVVERHPDLVAVDDLPPGWTATRSSPDQPWAAQRDQWAEDEA